MPTLWLVIGWVMVVLGILIAAFNGAGLAAGAGPGRLVGLVVGLGLLAFGLLLKGCGRKRTPPAGPSAQA